MEQLFVQRFGAIGEKIASFLPMFSLDVCGIIGKYAICDQPREKQVPKEMFSFSCPPRPFLLNMAIHPLTGHLWMTFADGLIIYDTVGKELEKIALKTNPCRINFNSHGLAIVVSINDWIYTIDSERNISIKQKYFDIETIVTDHHGSVFLSDHKQIFQLANQCNPVKSWSMQGRLLAVKDDEYFMLSVQGTTKLVHRNMAKTCIICRQSAFLTSIDSHGNAFICMTRNRIEYGINIIIINKQNEFITQFQTCCDVNAICIDFDGQIYIRGDENVHVYAFEIE